MNWIDNWETARSPLLASLLIVVLTALSLAVTHFVHARTVRLVRALERVREARRKQALTLMATLRWIVDILILGSALLMVLSALGVDVTPALASVGVAGLALSLGAQSLIKDTIGGVLILLENQYTVGDVIKVGTVSGTVERITLRSTHLRDAAGSLHMIPNGDVRVATNLTRDGSQAVVEVDLNYDEAFTRTLNRFARLAGEFSYDGEFEPYLLGPLRLMGPTTVKTGVATVYLMVKTEPGKQWEVGRALQRHLLEINGRDDIAIQRVALPPPGTDLSALM